MKVNVLCLHFMLITVLENVIAGWQGSSRTPQKALYENLLKNYNTSSRPVTDQGAAVKLSFSFELIKIYEVNSKKQRMSVVSRVTQEWHDESLCWNASEYSGFSSINIPPSKIWVPDIGLYNEIENKDHKKTGITTNIVVNSNGTCRWSHPLFIHSMCSIDVSYFPLDLQTCSLRFGSFSYPTNEVNLTQPRMLRIVPLYKNEEWMVYDSSVKAESIWDEKRMNNFSVIELSFSMERNSLYFFVEMLIPCFLISCLTILGFLLPPESGERMSLGMLILLAMTFFQQLTMKMVPLQDFPLISQYFFITTVEISIALFITTLTLNFYHHTHSKMPGFMKTIILDGLGKIICTRPPSEDGKKGRSKRSFNLSDRKLQLSSSSRGTSSDLQVDIELTEKSNSRNDVLETDLNDSKVGLVSFKTTEEGSSTSSSLRVTNNNGDATDSVELEGVKEGPNDWNKDWVLASRIIDRFSMYAAVVIGMLTVIFVFVKTPRFWSTRTSLEM